jgi:ferrochelatase
MTKAFDAVLMLAFGGPYSPEDIYPFLRIVTQGRRIPTERIEEVAHHYMAIGGKSPINEITLRQAKALELRLKDYGYELPVYIGMRNWHPFISETITEMSKRGIKRALGIIMSPFQCDASWNQYQRSVKEALEKGNINIDVEYLPPVFDHPLFVESCAEKVYERFLELPPEELANTLLVFTAHSIPIRMAEESPYTEQFKTLAISIARKLKHQNWMIAYQSRSGNPMDPWLEPDICDAIRELAKQGVRYTVVQPIGFLCDHVEVLYDIGIEAKKIAEENGVRLLRANTVNDDPKFIHALAESVHNYIKEPQGKCEL